MDSLVDDGASVVEAVASVEPPDVEPPDVEPPDVEPPDVVDDAPVAGVGSSGVKHPASATASSTTGSPCAGAALQRNERVMPSWWRSRPIPFVGFSVYGRLELAGDFAGPSVKPRPGRLDEGGGL